MTRTPRGRHPDAACTSACAHGPARRRLLAGGGGLAVVGSLAACGGGQDDAPGQSGAGDPGASGSGTRVPLADVPVGGSRYLEDADVVVAQPTEGELVAYDATCPHQGCMVSTTGAGGTLVCPCHGSAFALADGAVVQGPATEGLATLTATVDGADVVISG
ncbi:Rieske (2Fe-2S) protein [uncultured Serinicoccus sp.]|uniref:Rieske (2Fe-2S) protein n=1 Tax=uncultured Serinicoccus sp. TaxID=735514 RepID=UPI002608306B|nr:Rieske (2Fe-2S) protein [uncultured Serinicoccus sp.]